MAIVQNTITGRSSGSVGNVTFSTWKGKNVMKAKPTSVANPNTDGQQQQRSGMSQIVAVFRLIQTAVNTGFKKLAVGMSQYNAFVQANLTSAFDYSVDGVATLVPGDLLISKGSMAMTDITSIVADRSANAITFNWSPTPLLAGQSSDDKPIFAAYNADSGAWNSGLSTVDRSVGTATLPLPADAFWATGDNIRAYAAFYAPLTGESSDSKNLTGVIVA